ncbi:hypothetical protein TNCV_1426291 [Trichonephila clavipes]|nr:hypothetical protein TNCV_1426291 [Trichonephila clavipes]
MFAFIPVMVGRDPSLPLVVVGGLVYSSNPVRYVGGSLATGRVSQAEQVFAGSGLGVCGAKALLPTRSSRSTEAAYYHLFMTTLTQ